MRHVVVMTATSAVGLTALFLVDAANLFYISLLGQQELAAAIGFAGTIQFLMISVSIGLSIGATALVSRAIGAGDEGRARRHATSSVLILVLVLSLVTALVWLLREPILTLLGARGETHAIASRFLAIVLFAVPLLGVGMVCGGLLRAKGEAREAMAITLGSGAVAAVLDPLLIFVAGLGVEGAAIATVVARLAAGATGLWLAGRRHRLLAPPDARAALGDLRPLMGIAAPAVATQVSTPFGMAYLTSLVAAYGDAAVAGWAVVGRLTPLAFGGIFALSGSVGPIFGQNLGAGRHERLPLVMRDALLFAAGYVVAVWLILLALEGTIAAAFGLEADGIDVLETFASVGAAAYLFTAALFVSNACFNNLGRPMRSTLLNWTRDGVAIPLLALAVGQAAGPAGPVLVQAAAAVIVGTAAALLARRYILRLEAHGAVPEEAPLPSEVAAPFASGRSALHALVRRFPAAPLSERRRKR
jgi:putative MATE family efflux protein